MNLKKIKIISVIGIFIVCFISHFAYDLLPNTLFSIFFPVNESIWEHMKMLFTSVLIFSIIEYFLLKKFKIPFNNFLLNTLVESIIIIPIYLIMYYPFRNIIKDNMFIIISIMFIAILLSNLVGYLILKTKPIKYSNIISLLLIIISYVIFGYLTYYPPHNDLFFDTKEELYGINTYVLKEELKSSYLY